MRLSWGITAVIEAVIAAVAGYGVASALYIGVANLFRSGFPIWKRRKEPDEKEIAISDETVKWLIFVVFSALLVLVFLAGDLAIALSPFAVRFYFWFMTTFGLKATQLLIGLAVIFLGSGAFLFKLKYQMTYGIVEVLFAWLAGSLTARQIRPGGDWPGQLATLVGAIYIVSRGLGNIRDGVKARKGA
jgi:hypothetical protein